MGERAGSAVHCWESHSDGLGSLWRGTVLFFRGIVVIFGGAGELPRGLDGFERRWGRNKEGSAEDGTGVDEKSYGAA